MLEIKNITKTYPNFQLKDISFEVEKGAYFVLLGGSGSGKSMLLEIIAGNTMADFGKIIMNKKDITSEKIQKRNIAFVYQDQALFPHLSVFDNIAFPLRLRKLKLNEIRNQVSELSLMVGAENLLERKPGTLSGGEAQRVALARALATSPQCLMLDEPLSNIDTQLRYELRGLLRKINRQGQTIIHVTHDYEEAISLASKIAVIERGCIVQTGTSEEIFQSPKSEFIANFSGIKNFFKGNLMPSENNNNLRIFETSTISFKVATSAHKNIGFVLIPAESIVISQIYNEDSSQNVFKGMIIDIFPSRIGMEIIVDIGVKMASVITKESAERMLLEKGKEVWISFKASSVKYIAD